VNKNVGLIPQLSRREFTKLAVILPMTSGPKEQKNLDYKGGLTAIPGIRVGHFTESRRPTGCTVVLVEKGGVASVDVRGSAPGTRETDLLQPTNTVQQVHALVLSGGSAFGLNAAAGVVQYLEEKGIGYPTQGGPVPIVPAAILYDLGVGDSRIRPDHRAGYRACENASEGPIQEGNVGAGAGATVGKLLGADRAMKGGLGTASVQVDQLTVAALVAVNAVGDIVDPAHGHILAGARSEDGKSFANLAKVLRNTSLATFHRSLEHTTLGVVATNASFSKAGMQKIAQMSHDGLARAIHPVHMPADGDTIFSLSTGAVEGYELGQVGALAAQVTAEAITRAVLQAKGIPGYPAHSDL
jgi:L-aminopeptidase/D-esterase-like protein